MVWDELPQGWKVERLDTIATVRAGASAPQGQEYFADGEYPFVRAQDVGRYRRTKCLAETVDQVNDKALEENRMVLAKKGAILLPKSGASILTNNRAMLGIDAYVVSHLAIVEADEAIVSRDFLYHWLCEYDVTPHTKNKAYPSLSLSDIKSFEIPLPPLDEQRRIVARIEELTERIDAARRLRVEAAEEADAIVRMAALKAFRELECEEVPLGEVTDSSRYGTSKRASVEPVGYPMLRMNNITLDGRLDLADLKYVQLDERRFAKLRLHPGDIVVNRTNSKELVGKCAVFHVQDTDYVFASYLIRFRLNESKVDSDYAVYYLSSPLGREQVDARSHGATNQFNINAGELKSIPIPLPPLDEQRRLVEYLDAVQAKVEAIRRYQEEAQQEIEAMTGAVLERAFRGEL